MQKFCEMCGKKFETTTGQKFCSVECVKKAKVAQNKKYKQAKRKRATKICPTCGKEFTPKTNSQKYCMPECYRVAKNQQAKQIEIPKVCVICGAEFKAHSYATKACSPKCSLILRQQQAKISFQNIGKDKVIEVSEEELKVRVKSYTEEYSFKTLRQAVNFLSIFTEYNTAECIELLKQRKDKIGEYKIFYD